MPKELPYNCPIYTIDHFFEVHKVYVTSIPVFHSVGISTLSHISFSRLYKTFVVALISAFKTWDGILSITGALPSFSFLMALLISSMDILP